MNQIEYGIIDNVEIIALHAFGRNCLATVVENGLDTDDFRQNHVDDSFFAHFTPRLAVVVVLAHHQLLALFQYLVVKLGSTLARHIYGVRVAVTRLNNGGNAVIDYCAQVTLNVVAHKAHTRRLHLAYVAHLDIKLVGNAVQTENPPRRTVVLHFLYEDRTALGGHSVKIFIRICHNNLTV